MENIAIFGAGGFGKEVACLIELINSKERKWNLIGFFDDGFSKGSHNKYGKILGGINELNSYNEYLCIVIAFGNPVSVFNTSLKITNPNIDYANIIAPDVIFLDKTTVEIGKGNIICSSCLISCNVKIGNFNILNGFIPIGHDTIIGDYNSIMPSVKISGNVIIGNNNFFGVNSVVLQKIKIGNSTTIGASSLIVKDTKDDKTYVGVPAKIIKY